MTNRVQTFVGSIKNGQIQLSEPVELAENSRVFVVVPDVVMTAAATRRSPRLLQSSPADFIKAVVEVTADASI